MSKKPAPRPADPKMRRLASGMWVPEPEAQSETIGGEGPVYYVEVKTSRKTPSMAMEPIYDEDYFRAVEILDADEQDDIPPEMKDE